MAGFDMMTLAVTQGVPVEQPSSLRNFIPLAGMALILVLGVLLIRNLLRDRAGRGAVLADLGRESWIAGPLAVAALFGVITAVAALAGAPWAFPTFGLAMLLAFGLVMLCGKHLLLAENGVWVDNQFIPWVQIGEARWAKEGELFIRPWPSVGTPIYRRRIRPELRNKVDEVLAERWRPRWGGVLDPDMVLRHAGFATAPPDPPERPLDDPEPPSRLFVVVISIITALSLMVLIVPPIMIAMGSSGAAPAVANGGASSETTGGFGGFSLESALFMALLAWMAWMAWGTKTKAGPRLAAARWAGRGQSTSSKLTLLIFCGSAAVFEGLGPNSSGAFVYPFMAFMLGSELLSQCGFHEKGLMFHSSLISWDRIVSWRWEGEGRLVLQMKPKFGSPKELYFIVVAGDAERILKDKVPGARLSGGAGILGEAEA